MTLAAVCPQAEPPPSTDRAIEVFRTLALKLRPLTGRKARVLEWTRTAYEAAVTATLAELDVATVPASQGRLRRLKRHALQRYLPARGDWD